MSCLYTGGAYTIGCPGQGGTSEVYLNSFNKLDTYVLSSEGVIGTFSATGSYLNFEQDVNTAMFNEEIEKPNGLAAGPVAWNQTVEITLENITSANRNTIKQLGLSRFTIIVKDNNNNYRLVGKTSGAKATSIVFTGGKTKAEGNTAVITFTAQEGEPAYFCDEAGVLNAIA